MEHYPPIGALQSAPSYGTDLNAVRAGAELAEGEVQTHPDAAAHSEGSVKRLGEIGPEGVKVCHALCHAVERQRPRRQVQVDAQPRGVGHWYVPLLVVVHGSAAGVRQLQGPGLGVVTKPRPGVQALPAQGPVGYAHGGAPAPPLHLPVAALAVQRGLADHLGPAVEALGGVGVGLRCSLQGGLSVAFREN